MTICLCVCCCFFCFRSQCSRCPRSFINDRFFQIWFGWTKNCERIITLLFCFSPSIPALTSSFSLRIIAFQCHCHFYVCVCVSVSVQEIVICASGEVVFCFGCWCCWCWRYFVDTESQCEQSSDTPLKNINKLLFPTNGRKLPNPKNDKQKQKVGRQPFVTFESREPVRARDGERARENLRLKTVQAKRPDDCAILVNRCQIECEHKNDRLSEELMRAFRVISICYFISVFIYHHHHYYIHFHGSEPPLVTYISPLLHTNAHTQTTPQSGIFSVSH